MTTESPRENAAANAVADHLTEVFGIVLKPRKWDDGSAPRMHDFYVEGGVHKTALEVTTLADSERVGRYARWEREAPDLRIKVEGLVGCWVAYHEGDAEADTVIATIRAEFPRLAALGLTQLDTRMWQEHALALDRHRPSGYDASRALHLVGIRQASMITHASQELLDECAGEVQLIRGYGFDRPADRNFPVSVIHEQLRDYNLHGSDVRKLLAVEDATARHLWMWVELTEGLAMIRSLQDALPDADLDCEGIDGVWLGRGPAPGVVAGYVWLRDLGWSEFSTHRREVIGA